MSLINEALKRVKEAQRQAPPAASVGPPLRPIEPVPAPRRSLGILLPLGLVGVALSALFLIWTLAKKADSTGGLPVRAQSAVPQESAAARPAPEIVSRPPETAPAVSSASREPSPAGTVSGPPAALLASKGVPGSATATNSTIGETTNNSSTVQMA